MDIYGVNEATQLNDLDCWKICWAVNYQLRWQFGMTWRNDVHMYFTPGGANAHIPAGGAILHFVDNPDVQGALGYHDEDGNEVPYARVFVQTAKQAGDPVSEVASHEALELAADPNVNLCAMTGDGRRLYALEVGDPVQGSAYDVGQPYGRATGVVVANFALPSYFDPNSKPGTKVDFRGVLQSGPFTVAPQGYMSYVDLANLQQGWQQVFGDKRSALPPWVVRAHVRQPPVANT